MNGRHCRDGVEGPATAFVYAESRRVGRALTNARRSCVGALDMVVDE